MELQQTWRGVGKFACLGDRSYSIYLLHLPLMATAITVASRWIHFSGRIENLLIFLVLAGLAIVPIELFYRWVEAPSHVVSRRLAQSVDRACKGWIFSGRRGSKNAENLATVERLNHLEKT
jgi:peptidoglycan/LPS O-acetylase OafA/YrhL